MVGSGRERYFHNHFAILRIEFLYWKFHKLFPIATKYIVIGCYEGEKNLRGRYLSFTDLLVLKAIRGFGVLPQLGLSLTS